MQSQGGNWLFLQPCCFGQVAPESVPSALVPSRDLCRGATQLVLDVALHYFSRCRQYTSLQLGPGPAPRPRPPQCQPWRVLRTASGAAETILSSATAGPVG